MGRPGGTVCERRISFSRPHRPCMPADLTQIWRLSLCHSLTNKHQINGGFMHIDNVPHRSIPFFLPPIRPATATTLSMASLLHGFDEFFNIGSVDSAIPSQKILIAMGSPLRSGNIRKSNESMKFTVTVFLGVVFGFLLGISFRTLLLAKINRPSGLWPSIDLTKIEDDGRYSTIPNKEIWDVWASLSCDRSIPYNGAQKYDEANIWVPTNPRGAERLPPDIVKPESDLYLRQFWDLSVEDLTTKPRYLVTFTVGFDQKDNIEDAVKKFSRNFTILLFHYDGRTSEWDQFEWSKRAIHISAPKQSKWWFAKRFLHPDIVAPFDYIFIWDEDLGVEHFDAEEYLKLVRKHGLEISQPGLEPNRDISWEMTKRRDDSEVHKDAVEREDWCPDPHSPPCAAFVEIMAPVFSRDAWRCVWHMIQNDLIHGWGIDFALRRCVEPPHQKIGVVDTQWIVHQRIPSLGDQGQAQFGRAPWKGVKERCHAEWAMFRDRMANAERDYFQALQTGFAFGKMAKERRSGEGSSEGATLNLRNNASKLSYRDKLLSPGCAGFLVKHSEEDDIMRGWKEYFHKMNKEEPQSVQEESEEEEDQTSRRTEGKPGKLSFTAEEYSAWCLPWMNSLIIKVLGASFPTYVIRDRINRMWRPRDALKLIPLSNGYYIVSFSNKEDREYAFQEGPWMIEDHYLIVQRWRPNFNPWKADLQCNIAAWVRLPDVPFEFYNVESLRRLGNMIGKMIKVDRSTSIYDKGGFARICVEIDLKKPLLPTYMVFGEERPIIYEGLHHVCFTCSKYRHQKNECPLTKTQGSSQGSEPESTGNVRGEEGDKPMETGIDAGGDGEVHEEVHLVKEKDVGAGSNQKHRINTVTRGGGTESTDGEANDGSPFGKLQVLRRDFRGHLILSNLRKGINEDKSPTVTQRSHDDLHDSRMKSLKKEKAPNMKKEKETVSKEIKSDLVLSNGFVKPEWVPVGSKRKNQGKGKVKGKENLPPSSRNIRKSSLNHGTSRMTSNNYTVLQNLEDQHKAINVINSPTCVGPKAANGMDIPLGELATEKSGGVVSLMQTGNTLDMCWKLDVLGRFPKDEHKESGFSNMELIDGEGTVVVFGVSGSIVSHPSL
ncbi:hypothetical protein K1719_008359 [Acacia pycnantha]|nr:hypothetical protein K1719_008359 [Acacia pycnantha]